MQHEKDPMLASHIGHFLVSSLGGSRLMTENCTWMLIILIHGGVM